MSAGAAVVAAVSPANRRRRAGCLRAVQRLVFMSAGKPPDHLEGVVGVAEGLGQVISEAGHRVTSRRWRQRQPGSRDSCSLLRAEAGARGDAVQVVVGEPVAVTAQFAGQGTLGDPFTLGGSGLADQACFAQQIAPGTGLRHWARAGTRSSEGGSVDRRRWTFGAGSGRRTG